MVTWLNLVHFDRLFDLFKTQRVATLGKIRRRSTVERICQGNWSSLEMKAKGKAR